MELDPIDPSVVESAAGARARSEPLKNALHCYMSSLLFEFLSE